MLKRLNPKHEKKKDLVHPVLAYYPEVDPKLFINLQISQEPGMVRAMKEFLEREKKRRKETENPLVRRNPPLVAKVWGMVKRAPAGRCAYCGQSIEPGAKCIAVQYFDRTPYNHSQTAHLHISCWHRAGDYPPLYMPKGETRKMPEGPQGQLF